MRRDRVTIGHKTISYLVREPAALDQHRGQAQTAVFLHAFPLHAAMWTKTLEAMPAAWRGIAPDYRGFGESPQPAGNHRMTDLAGDVIDLLDRLEVSQAVFVGCSMGGYVAFSILKSAPRYVAGLVLVSTRPGADSEQGRKNRETMLADVDREGVGALGRQMAPKLVGETTRQSRPDLVDHVRQLIEENHPDGVRAAIRAMMEREDSTPLLSRIEAPTLVVHGVEDGLIPVGEGEGMHRAIRHSEYEPMAACGHLPNLEQDGHFHARVGRFLNQL